MKKIIAILTFVISVVMLTGCGPTDEESATALVKSEIVKRFKDPQSALYRNVNVRKDAVEDKWWVCGEVNSKNSYGAYVGFDRFYGIVEGRSPELKVKATQSERQTEKLGYEFYFSTYCK